MTGPPTAAGASMRADLQSDRWHKPIAIGAWSPIEVSQAEMTKAGERRAALLTSLSASDTRYRPPHPGALRPLVNELIADAADRPQISRAHLATQATNRRVERARAARARERGDPRDQILAGDRLVRRRKQGFYDTIFGQCQANLRPPFNRDRPG